MPTKEVSFQNEKGHALSGIIKYPDDVEAGIKFPVVVVLHGFNETKHNDLTATTANHLFPYGFLTLRFDFHGHGESEGKYEEHTLTQQIQDVEAAIDYLEELPNVDKDRVAIIGTDLGGDIAILIAAQDIRVKCLIIQGARSHLEHHITSHFAEHEVKELKTEGYYRHPLYNLREAYISSAKRHDIIEAVKMLKIPLLILHAIDDLRVPIHESRQLFLAANQPKALEEIENADHWMRQDTAREKFFELTVSWLKRYL
jgi:dipeptidyl aminopeptidase/acylaminoacyl peptidase